MSKKTSKRMAAIAARVMTGGDWSTKDVKALAASVLAQVESERPAAERAKERCS